MLGVQDQRDVHHLLVQRAGRATVEQLQEMPADGVGIALGVDAHTVLRVAPPVSDDGRKNGEQAVGHVLLLGKIGFGFQIAQHRAAGAHHIHGMGAGRNAFQYFAQWRRQFTQALELGLICRQPGRRGQLAAMQQQIGDFLEAGIGRQIAHVITAIGQSRAFLADRTQTGFASDLAAQPGAAERFFLFHDTLLGCNPSVRIFIRTVRFVADRPYSALFPNKASSLRS